MPQRKFFTGNTGTSTGPHLHAALFDVESGAWLDPTPHMGALLINGKPLLEVFPKTSGYGHRTAPTKGASSFHQGVDVGTPEGTGIEVAGGTWAGTAENGGYGRESTYDWVDQTGRKLQWKLAHGSRELNAIASRQALAAAGASSGATPAATPAAGDPPPQTPPDWRAAASASGRSTDPSSAAYWEREDMKQWAAANPKLAAPLLARAGVKAPGAQAPEAQTPGAQAPAAEPALPSNFQPLDRGALGGVQVAPLSSYSTSGAAPLEDESGLYGKRLPRWLQAGAAQPSSWS